MPVQRAPNCEQSHGTPPGSLQAIQRPVVMLTDSSTLRHRYFVVLRDLKVDNIQGGPKKRGHRLMTIIISNLNRFKNFFHWKVRCKKFAVKWILKIPPHLAYVATLPCETLMSPKHAINNKLQGSVATYLRFGGVVNNQIKKRLLLSLRVKFIF